MPKHILIITCLIFFKSVSGYSQIDSLEKRKLELIKQIEVLEDSIDLIDNKINYLKSEEIKKLVNDSSLTAVIHSGARLKTTIKPKPDIIPSIRLNFVFLSFIIL